jgi:hypothetical protein
MRTEYQLEAEPNDQKRIQVEEERLRLATSEFSKAGARQSMPRFRAFANHVFEGFSDYVIESPLKRLEQWGSRREPLALAVVAIALAPKLGRAARRRYCYHINNNSASQGHDSRGNPASNLRITSFACLRAGSAFSLKAS